MGTVGLKVAIDTRGIDAALSEAKARNITMKGLRAGIRLLVPAARSGAPKRSGALKQAQGQRVAKGRRGRTIAFAVQGARAKYQRTYKGKVVKPGKYDHLVQGGTVPHAIGQGRHPGARPNPYRRRAVDSRKGEIGRVILSTMGAELQKVLAKNAAKVRA